ncbi:MAG TPA: hypothetical protein VIM81_14895 [Gammaproteobacteria bacterium]
MRRVSNETKLALSRCTASCLVCVLALAIARDVAAQDGATNSVLRMADDHPDLSGVWWGGADVGGRGFRPGGGRRSGEAAPPSFTDLYQPWAKERAAQLADKDDPTLRCVSTAFGTLNVRLWDVGAVGQILSTPRFVVLLSETFHGYQLVPTDGRPHRDAVPPSWRGDAVGRWEGDTFVVETKNFTDDTWISAEGRVSFHSDALRIVERYRRVDADTLVIDATVYDPKVLTEPWVVPTQTLQLAPFDQLLPLNCTGTETGELAGAGTEGRG